VSDDAFRDRIAEAVDQVDQHEPWWSLKSTEVADAILAMPEMQAVKAALLSADFNGDLDFMWWTLGRKAPSFLSWVLGGPS